MLGKNVLEHWVEKLRDLGVHILSVTEHSSKGSVAPASLFTHARQGVERLLVICLESYAELDLGDFVRFHRETHSSVTEVIDREGPLGIRLFNRTSLLSPPDRERNPSGSGTQGIYYHFAGYVKRLLSADKYQDLVADALGGRCAIRPLGQETREGIWLADDVKVDPSVRLMGPCYLGSQAIVRAGATIGPFTNIEAGCVVDCGTTVNQSSLLPRSYLAPGLCVRRCVVDGGRLTDLDSETTVDLDGVGLGHRIRGAFPAATAWPTPKVAPTMGAVAELEPSHYTWTDAH